MKEARRSIKRDDTSKRMGNGLKKSLLSQVRDDRVIDIEERAAALRRRSDRRVERRDFLVGLHVVDSDGDLIGDFYQKFCVRFRVLVLREASHGNRPNPSAANGKRQRT